MTAKPVLVVAAHPDDEALGCGATMARMAAEGAKVSVLFLADGETSRFGSNRDAVIGRQKAAHQACAVLGASDVTFHQFPDNRLDTVALLDIVRVIEAALERLQPFMVLTHHGGDLNIDHRRANQAVVTACRPLRGRSVSVVRSFEIPSSTEWATMSSGDVFRPNFFCEASAHWSAKIAALQIYHSEMKDYPHPRSVKAIEALARYRGCSAGMELAEAFFTERELVR